MKVALQNEVFTIRIKRGIEIRKLLECRDHRFDEKHQRRQFQLLTLFPEAFAESLHLRDIGLLKLGDVRDHCPIAREVGAGNLFDPRQRLRFHFAELGKVDLRPGQQIQPTASSTTACARGRGCTERRFDEGLHVFFADPALAARAGNACEFDTQFACKQAHAR